MARKSRGEGTVSELSLFMRITHCMSIFHLSLVMLFLLTGTSFAAYSDITINSEAELRDVLNKAGQADRILVNQNIALFGPINASSGDSNFALATTNSNFSPPVPDFKILGNSSGSAYILYAGSRDISSISKLEMSNGHSTEEGKAGAYTGHTITGEQPTVATYGGSIIMSAFRNNSTTSTIGGGAIYLTGDMKGRVDQGSNNLPVPQYAIGSNSIFENNKATAGSGGAVYVAGDLGGIATSTFTGNEAAKNGGAVYAKSFTGDIKGNNTWIITGTGEKGVAGTDFVAGVHFVSNKAGGDGGAFYAETMTGGIFTPEVVGNTAGGNGGALSIGTLKGNIWGDDNMGIGEDGDTTLIKNFNAGFRNNTAGGNGGAINLGSMTGDIHGNFVSNTAAGSGGAINVSGVFQGNITPRLIKSDATVFSNNKAGSYGGAVYLQEINGNISADFLNNTATGGGGALFTGTFNGNLTNSNFIENKVNGDGGAFLGAPNSIDGVSFLRNEATDDGGAIFTPGSGNANKQSNIYNSTFIGNKAGVHAGALYYGRSIDITLKNTKFQDNTSGLEGGAILLDVYENDTKYNLTLSADEGKETSFINNTHHVGSSTAPSERNSFTVEAFGASGTVANVSIEGKGTVNLSDPYRVDTRGANSSFTLNHSDPNSTLIMSGKNIISMGNNASATLNFKDGLTRLTRDAGDFDTIVSTGSGSTFNMTWGAKNVLAIEDMGARDHNLPLIDITGVQGAKNVTIENGAAIDLTRQLKSFTNSKMLLVKGLDPNNNPNASGITVLHPDGYTKAPRLENGNTELWLDDLDKIPDAFSPDTTTANVTGGEAGITNWLNDTPQGLTLTPQQVIDLRRDFTSGPPEAIIDMALIGMDIHDMAVRAARTGFYNSGYDQPPTACPPVDDCPPVDFMPVADCLPTSRFRIWGSYLGGIDNARSSREHPGYETTTNGGLVGAAWQASPAFSVGAYFGYSRSSVDFKDISAEGDSDAIHTGIQMAVQTHMGLRIAVDGSYSHHSADVRRHPGNLGDDHSSFNQKLYGAGVEASWPLYVSERTRLIPAASLDATWVKQNAVTESGPVMAAAVDEIKDHRLVSRVGATVAHDFAIARGVITPSFGANWKHRFHGRQLETHYAFLDNLNDGHLDKDSIRSRKSGADSLELSTFVDANLWAGKSNWSLRAGYILDVGDRELGHMFYGGVGVSF